MNASLFTSTVLTKRRARSRFEEFECEIRRLSRNMDSMKKELEDFKIDMYAADDVSSHLYLMFVLEKGEQHRFRE